ncbi:hypothetical protein GCM10012320_32930 [Sinomonas cellulolyticus]|uniref:Uncharacterized protein n=1 Tax=Sinomonas cellulolyticus TaxID=2801916 RepID=A0ABS1JXA9_9MICC|nr:MULTISPECIES: DUF5663 domain-containing protein [Sinomonas]MBL0703986.1 hypothetical protein [Sinomonas cellulolyticus]GHG59041.1 hypothetical protein GCM10012320_32930 [Sinomonas sp. KCTC 49339]
MDGLDAVPGFLVEGLRGIPAAAALPAADFAGLALRVHEELEMRVGGRLMAGLSGAQLDEFDAVTEYENTHPGDFGEGKGPAMAWMEANRPGWRQIAQEETDRILAQTRQALHHTPDSTPS